MNQDLELKEFIASARDVPQAGTACRRVAGALGFEHFLYGLRIAVTLSRPCQFVLSGYPKGWRTLYDEQGYMMIDPVLARGAATVAPFGWDEIERDKPATQRLFEDASRFGLAYGLTVPVHCANGEFGIMSFARDRPLPHGASRIRLFQRAQWLVANIQERMRQLIMESEAAREPRLTARERDCLRHAAQGLSSAAIGRKLQIAESTVVYHLNAAERKLGVRTRNHAIARAVALGVIESDSYPAQIGSSQQLLELPG
ncbi:MAG TPA: LuxR family transcriptional regulator [Nevskiaceae bacterium]|nr:LuxR family transcriptional regulator [Nevskiaceae bacterium]